MPDEIDKQLQGQEPFSIAYKGKPSPIAKIQLFNIIMLIPTLGVYRFWAITRLRRYFWSSLKINGTKLEYTGRGKELFWGLIVVLLVLVPLVLVLSLVSNLIVLQSQLLYILFNLLVLTAFYFLSYAAVFLRRRYLLSRTKWRGIRMAIKGSPWAFGRFGLKQVLLQIITLGLYTPYAEMNIHQRLWNNSLVGSQPLANLRKMQGVVKAYFGLWIITFIGISVVVYIVSMAAIVGEFDPTTFSVTEGTSSENQIYFVLVGIVLWGAAYIWQKLTYEARKVRNVINGLSFQNVNFESGFKPFYLLKTYAIIYSILAILFALVFALTTAFIDTFKTGFLAHLNNDDLTLLVTFIIVYFVSKFLIPIVVTHRILRDIVKTTTCFGTIMPTAIEQSDAEVMTRGEGLANALDVGGF